MAMVVNGVSTPAVIAAALNEEIRRRERAIRIFPNEASAIRVGRRSASKNERGLAGAAYSDMSELQEWKASASPPLTTTTAKERAKRAA